MRESETNKTHGDMAVHTNNMFSDFDNFAEQNSTAQGGLRASIPAVVKSFNESARYPECAGSLWIAFAGPTLLSRNCTADTDHRAPSILLECT